MSGRRCNVCGEVKSWEDMARKPVSASSTGYAAICKPCDAAKQRERRARMRAESLAASPPAPLPEDEDTDPGTPPGRWQENLPRVAAGDLRADRILCIGDTHAPFAHPSALDFLAAIRTEFAPDLVVHQGDETDQHGLSFHEHNPALPGGSDEIRGARGWLGALEALYPAMVLLESNHGSLLYRKALHHGIPEEMLRNYNEVLEVGDGWRWQFSLTVQTSSGPVYFEHGQKATARTLSKRMGLSVVQGHRHNEAYAEWWNNSIATCFAVQTGCLIDNRSRAFLSHRKNETHPIIASALILDGQPCLIRLNEGKSGRWDGRLVWRAAA
jgi:hypothetical protein